MSAPTYGIVLAEVVSVDDPNKLGYLQLRLTTQSADALTQWAPVARPLASGGFGLWFQPKVGDMVIVAFEQGQVERPYVLGAIFTGDNTPPTTEPKQRFLQTEAGHKLIFDDTSGSEAITIEDASGNLIRMEKSGITIESKASLTLKGVEVTIEASAQLTGKGSPIHLNP